MPSTKRNSAEMRGGGGLWERKSYVGKISVLWLLYEAVLAAPKQTVGLAKTHLRQEGRLQRSSAGSGPLFQLFPVQASAHRESPRKTSWLGALSVWSELFGSLIESNKRRRGCPQVSGGKGVSGAHLCVRHDSAHTFCLLLHTVLGEVHEGHGAVLRGSISHLEGPERVFGTEPGEQKDEDVTLREGPGVGSGLWGMEAVERWEKSHFWQKSGVKRQRHWIDSQTSSASRGPRSEIKLRAGKAFSSSQALSLPASLEQPHGLACGSQLPTSQLPHPIPRLS